MQRRPSSASRPASGLTSPVDLDDADRSFLETNILFRVREVSRAAVRLGLAVNLYVRRDVYSERQPTAAPPLADQRGGDRRKPVRGLLWCKTTKSSKLVNRDLNGALNILDLHETFPLRDPKLQRTARGVVIGRLEASYTIREHVGAPRSPTG